MYSTLIIVSGFNSKASTEPI